MTTAGQGTKLFSVEEIRAQRENAIYPTWRHSRNTHYRFVLNDLWYLRRVALQEKDHKGLLIVLKEISNVLGEMYGKVGKSVKRASTGGKKASLEDDLTEAQLEEMSKVGRGRSELPN